jgi:hypothetical protein
MVVIPNLVLGTFGQRPLLRLQSITVTNADKAPDQSIVFFAHFFFK